MKQTKGNGAETLATAMVFIGVLTLLGTGAALIQVRDEGIAVLWSVVGSGVAAALMFFGIGCLLNKAVQAEARMDAMLREIQSLKAERRAPDPVEAWEHEQAAKAGPPPAPSGWQDRLTE